jgi:hypothetical protein
MSDQNAQALAAYVHTLTGITGNIGAKALHAKLAPISAKLHHQAQLHTNKIDDEDIALCKSLAHDIALLTRRISDTFSDQTTESAGKRAIDDKTLSEKWSDLLVRTSNNDSTAIDLAEELLSTYELDMEVTYRLKKCLTALENFEFDEAQQHLTL